MLGWANSERCIGNGRVIPDCEVAANECDKGEREDDYGGRAAEPPERPPSRNDGKHDEGEKREQADKRCLAQKIR